MLSITFCTLFTKLWAGVGFYSFFLTPQLSLMLGAMTLIILGLLWVCTMNKNIIKLRPVIDFTSGRHNITGSFCLHQVFYCEN